MDKNTLHKLLEKNKLAETLMKDESFKNEAKKLLKKEEKSDISDDDLMKILNSIEKVISGNVKIEIEADLDKVSGGTNIVKSIARKAIIAVSLAAGSIVGGIGTAAAMIQVVTTNKNAVGVGMLTGAGAGGAGGYEFGKLICNKLGLYD
jgi:hypothetical protein